MYDMSTQQIQPDFNFQLELYIFPKICQNKAELHMSLFILWSKFALKNGKNDHIKIGKELYNFFSF